MQIYLKLEKLLIKSISLLRLLNLSMAVLFLMNDMGKFLLYETITNASINRERDCLLLQFILDTLALLMD